PGDAGTLFNGINEYVRADLEKDFVEAEAITLSAFVKLNRTHGTQTFLNRGQRGDLFTLYLYNDHVRMLVEYEPGRYRYASAQPPPANTWVHYAGTYDGRTIRLYVNGSEVDAVEAPGRIPSRNDPLFIGATSPSLNVVDGWMAHVRVFAAALS